MEAPMAGMALRIFNATAEAQFRGLLAKATVGLIRNVMSARLFMGRSTRKCMVENHF
jgi:Co/Zn/Cd efflux system component